MVVLRLFLLYVQFRADAMVSGKIGVLSAVRKYIAKINSFDKNVIRAIIILRFVEYYLEVIMGLGDLFRASENAQLHEQVNKLQNQSIELQKKIEEKQKDEIFSALLASGKTVEEVMMYLKSGNEKKAE